MCVCVCVCVFGKRRRGKKKQRRKMKGEKKKLKTGKEILNYLSLERLLHFLILNGGLLKMVLHKKDKNLSESGMKILEEKR